MERIDYLENQINNLHESGQSKHKEIQNHNSYIGKSQNLQDREIIEYIGEDKFD